MSTFEFQVVLNTEIEFVKVIINKIIGQNA